MSMITQETDINLVPGTVPPRIHVSQYDEEGSRTLSFDLVAAETYDVSNITAIIEGLKPDGNYFAYDCTVSDGVVTIPIELQMTACAGDVECTLMLMDGDEVLRTINFILVVDKKPMPTDAVVSDTEIPAIIELGRQNAENAEAWAVGERDGEEVDEDDETYQNNSKWYSSISESWAVGGTGNRSGEDTDNSSYYASESASSASASADSAEDSEAWAVGQRGGVDVTSGDDTYENNSKYYAGEASDSADDAADSATLSESWAVGGTSSRSGEDTNNSSYYATQAASSASDAADSETNAATSETNAATSESNASDYADEAHGWCDNEGDSGSASYSATNNAYYWAQYAQTYATGALHWKGSVAFANIPTTSLTTGDMYNVTDSFTTDSRFSEGSGIVCPAGTNIIWNGSLWDLQSPPGVNSFNSRTGAVVPTASDYDADQIDYDNTTSGLSSTDVQGAIDELAAASDQTLYDMVMNNFFYTELADDDDDEDIADDADDEIILADWKYKIA